MKMTLVTTATFTLALLLAACGGSGGEQNATDLAANETASDMNMTADADNPFGQSEMTMSERMMAAVGTDVGDTWVRKMIEHHQGAIDMSRIMLRQSPPADVAKMAQETITKQEKEIADLRKLVKEGSPDQQSATPYRAAETQMHEAMMAAGGGDVTETFMRKMLEHHKGGVALSDVALNNGVIGPVREHAQKTKTGQQKETAMVEAMLRGEPMEKAQPATTPEPSAKATPAQSTAQKAPTTAPKAPQTKAAPAPAKSAQPTAKSTCSDEHAAMGHCTQ